MSNKLEGKTTIAFRVNPNLLKKFNSIVYDQYGYGGISKVLETLITRYVEKFDDSIEQNDPILNAPSIMADLEHEIIPFLKTLDLIINSSPNNKEGMLDGPLEYVLNNCREAAIYARALRVRRVLGTTSFETQKQTKMSYDEAYKMIKVEDMEKHMNRKLYELSSNGKRNEK